MPALIQNAIAISAALIFFANSLFINNQQVFITHTENENFIVFHVKTKVKDDTVVSIDKNSGKVNIKFKDKRQGIEFDLEYGNDIAPADREMVNSIMTNIAEYTKKDKTIKGKVKHWVKDFVNRKL